MFEQYKRFESLLLVSADLYPEYGLLMGLLLADPPWPDNRTPISRIPWKKFRDARQKLQSVDSPFNVPGIYIFGAGEIPRYLGMAAKQTLWLRISGRDIGGPKTQCRLAETYQHAIIHGGIGGFPPELKLSLVRRTGAVDFARHGIDSVWVALIPAHEKRRVPQVEEALISAACKWNETRNLPPMLNRQHATGG